MSTVAHILKNASEQKTSLDDFRLIINKLILSVLFLQGTNGKQRYVTVTWRKKLNDLLGNGLLNRIHLLSLLALLYVCDRLFDASFHNAALKSDKSFYFSLHI